MVVGHSLFFAPERLLESIQVRVGLRQLSKLTLASGSTAYMLYDGQGRLRRCRLKLASNRIERPRLSGDMNDMSFHPRDPVWLALVKFADKKDLGVLLETNWNFDADVDCVAILGDAEYLFLQLPEIQELDGHLKTARVKTDAT